MTISGGVLDQRVYGNYGPAAPATILATLLDGTGVNMLLVETAADQPSRLVLTPRIAGPSLPSPSAVPDTDAEDAYTAPAQRPYTAGTVPGAAPAGSASTGNLQTVGNPNQTPVPQPMQGSAVTDPPQIPQPFNINSSPRNVDATVSTLPAPNSVPLDALPTPSSAAPAPTGIVSAPSPPPAGSDTAKVWGSAFANSNGQNAPDTTNGSTTAPTAPNANAPANSTQPATGTTNPPSGEALTPQQVYQQLQQLRQQAPPAATPPPPQ